ncbi:MAG: hypothetical protein Fur0043_16820 [Anaerolineales bacterium]
MPRIRCHYLDCVFIDDGYCSAAAVEIDPDAGCATYSPLEDANEDNEWIDDELEEWEDDTEEEDEDLWLDDEDDL